VSQFLSIIFAAALVNNVVLVQFLGVSSLFAYSHSLNAAIKLAWVSGLVMFASATVNILLAHFILRPLNLEFLALVSYVLISAVLTRLLLMQIDRGLTDATRRHGLEFLLISGNSAIVGLSLINTASIRSIPENITYSLGAACGFAAVLILFAALRERLDTAAVPAPLRGAPVHLISAGIVAMCLLGFAGLV